MISKRKAQARALDLIQRHNILEPPVNVERIAEDLGIEVRSTNFEDNVSGLLVRRGDEVVLGVNADHSENRQRFSIAHEIGHFVLHMTKPIFVDECLIRFRNQASKDGVNREEIEANAFAAELLMPEHLVRQEMDSLDYWDEDTVEQLSRKFKVSQDAFVFRLTNLGYGI